jgi:hypothetical protein
MSIIAENDDALRVGPEGLELAAVRTLADDANQGPRPDELILNCLLLGDAAVPCSKRQRSRMLPIR